MNTDRRGCVGGDREMEGGQRDREGGTNEAKY